MESHLLKNTYLNSPAITARLLERKSEIQRGEKRASYSLQLESVQEELAIIGRKTIKYAYRPFAPISLQDTSEEGKQRAASLAQKIVEHEQQHGVLRTFARINNQAQTEREEGIPQSLRSLNKKLSKWLENKSENIATKLVQKFTNTLKERQENEGLRGLLKNPEKHKKEVKREVTFAVLNAGGRRPLSENLLKAKNIVQVGGLLGDHIPLPIPEKLLPLIPIVLPLLPHLILHLASGVPILTSSLIIAGIYNIPNAIQAFSEKRFKKGIYEAAILTPLSIIVPFGLLNNSFWQETFIFRRLEYQQNKQIISDLHETIANSGSENIQAKNFYEETFKQVLREEGMRGKNLTEDQLNQTMIHTLAKNKGKLQPALQKTNQRIIASFNHQEGLKNFLKRDYWFNRNILTKVAKNLIRSGIFIASLFEHAKFIWWISQKDNQQYQLETIDILEKAINHQIHKNTQTKIRRIFRQRNPQLVI